MRARALHRDVLVATSSLLQVNCVILRGPAAAEEPSQEGPLRIVHSDAHPSETFVIDSPVLPEELDALGALAAQAGFPEPSGLLATHADWDHLLGRLAFPELALGCAESSARRLAAEPGDAQRRLREFDEELYIVRPQPLALGSVQPLPVPGHCEIGAGELELHPTGGHTADGMAIWAGWAEVLIVGDYLSAIELPMLSPGGGLEVYRQTLEVLRGLVERAAHVVPGHGPVLDGVAAMEVLEEDLAYLDALSRRESQLPEGRRDRSQRALHERNLQAL